MKKHIEAKNAPATIDEIDLDAVQGGFFREILKKFVEGARDGAWDMAHKNDTNIQDLPDGTLA